MKMNAYVFALKIIRLTIFGRKQNEEHPLRNQIKQNGSRVFFHCSTTATRFINFINSSKCSKCAIPINDEKSHETTVNVQNL